MRTIFVVLGAVMRGQEQVKLKMESSAHVMNRIRAIVKGSGPA